MSAVQFHATFVNPMIPLQSVGLVAIGMMLTGCLGKVLRSMVLDQKLVLKPVRAMTTLDCRTVVGVTVGTLMVNPLIHIQDSIQQNVH
jgi:hypothetical protein